MRADTNCVGRLSEVNPVCTTSTPPIRLILMMHKYSGGDAVLGEKPSHGFIEKTAPKPMRKVRSLGSSPMVVDGIVAMVIFFIAGPLLHRFSECVFSFTSELTSADEGPARSSYLNQHTGMYNVTTRIGR